jgi:hypothetical protein
MLPNLEEIYRPYAGDAKLKVSLLYWTKEAANLQISEEVMNASIAEAFLEIQNGKEIPVGYCHCKRCGPEGFSVPWSCVALNHYVLEKMMEKKDVIDLDKIRVLQQGIEVAMLSIIGKQNREYTEANMTVRPFLDWSRSPTAKLYKKVKDGLLRNIK